MTEAPQQLDLFIPPVITARGDGTFLVKAGKPVQKPVEVNVKTAAKLLKCSTDTVHRYCREGRLTARQPVPHGRVWLLLAEVEAFANRHPHADDDETDP